MKETGVVKWFSNKKGYGFIQRNQPKDGIEEVFVHWSNIEMDGYKTLIKGIKVEYEIAPGKKENRIEAKNVKIIF